MTRKHNTTPSNDSQPDAVAQQLAHDATSEDITAQQFEAEVEKANDAEVAAALQLDGVTDLNVADARANVKENAENEAFLNEIMASE